nr:phenylalanine--trna ligase, mitochondrial [Quercus suber]
MAIVVVTRSTRLALPTDLRFCLRSSKTVPLRSYSTGESSCQRCYCGLSQAVFNAVAVSLPRRYPELRFFLTPATGPKVADVTIDGKTYVSDSWTNVPSSIIAQSGRQLHVQPNHPISLTRKLIESRFKGFRSHNNLKPVVTVDQNFDSLGFALDHPGRSRTDTYYINQTTVLRTHTSAHEVDTFRENQSDGWTLSADVYRRDAVDKSHYPVFHQMEAALTWDRTQFSTNRALLDHMKAAFDSLPRHDLVVEDPNPPFHLERNPLQTAHHSEEEATMIAAHLKRSLEDMVVTIFAEADKALAVAGRGNAEDKEPLKVRWVEAFFPHTSPSWEMEVWWRGDWLEILGCGVIDQPLLDRAGQPSRIGWAFGLGLERIAMLLFGIPDIRLFWSKDPRFLNQFDENQPIRRFQPFSKHPAAPRDVAFWLPSTSGPVISDTAAASSSTPSPAGGQHTEPTSSAEPAFHENDLMEIVRNVAGDSVEDVTLIDSFTNRKTGRKSLCYRIVYRSLEKTLTNKEANSLHERIRMELVRNFGVELR